MPTGYSQPCILGYGKAGYFDSCTNITCIFGGGHIAEYADAMHTLALKLLCSQSDALIHRRQGQAQFCNDTSLVPWLLV